MSLSKCLLTSFVVASGLTMASVAMAATPYGVPPEQNDGYGQVQGAPPDNAFDPTRPYGGQAAITAPPGTAAFAIERQKRRDFCEASPSRC